MLHRRNLAFIRNSRKYLRKVRKKPLIDVLLPPVRQRVLGLTLGNPERWWYLSELAVALDEQTTQAIIRVADEIRNRLSKLRQPE